MSGEVDAGADSAVIEAEVVDGGAGQGGTLTLLPTLIDTLELHEPVVAYLAELGSAESRRRIRGALGRAGALLAGVEGKVEPELLPWHELRREHALAVRTLLGEVGASASTINVTLSAMRGVAKACWLAGEMGAEDYQRIAALKGVKQSRLPAGRLLGPGELQALFSRCARDAEEGNPAGPRDAALLGVLYAGGLRREEASTLSVADVDVATGEVVVRAGEGNKDRNVYLAVGAKAAMSDWLELRGEAPGPLWSRVRKGGHLALPVTGMSDRSIGDLCHRRAAWSGLKPFTPHDLRRTFISNLLDGGVDLVTVQRLAGHSSPATTGRYGRRGEAAKKKAATAIHVAYEQGQRGTT